MTNNKLFVLETRKITFNGKTSIFTAGDVVTESKMRRLNAGRVPSWTISATDIQALVIRNNRSIDENNEIYAPSDFSSEEMVKVALAEEYLLSLGITRDSFVFGKNTSLAFKNSTKETIWVGVKMEQESDAFIGSNGKRVSLNLNNWVSISTFLRRVEKGQPLFLHGNF